MFLYTTVLLIKNQPIRYEVSTQEKNRYLISKPGIFFRKTDDQPSFWITRKNGKWAPLNIKDEQLCNQVIKDISMHNME